MWQFDGVAPQQVKAVHFELRPIYRVEFRNVALRPNVQTHVETSSDALDPSPTNDPAFHRSLAFGPVVEQVVTNEINFDPGPDWRTDVIFEDPVFVFAVDIERTSLIDRDWDKMSPEQLRSILDKRRKPARGDWNIRTATFPLTLGFRTDSGAMGILQITGTNRSPPGVKLRFKLAQEPKPASQNEYVAFHPAARSTAALDAARDYVIGHKWQLKGESGGDEGVTLKAVDANGKRVTFNETLQANGMTRLTVSTEPGATLSATEIGAQLWHQFELTNGIGANKPLPNPDMLPFQVQAGQGTNASLGPVIERVVPFGAPCRQLFFQFRNGLILEIGRGPSTTKEQYDEDLKRADDSGGVDAEAFGGEDGAQFVGAGCLFTHEHSPNWTNITAQEVIAQLSRATWITGVIEITKKDLPATWLFKTARGEMGVMQLLGSAKEGRSGSDGRSGPGLELRYKLVQGAKSDGTRILALKLKNGTPRVVVRNAVYLWRDSG